MSPRAAKVCTVDGCTAPAWANSRCETHRLDYQRQADRRRPNARQRGYTTEWERYAKAYLEVHRTCVVCGGPADRVDHIDGKGPSGPRGYDPSNLRAACLPCHARFSSSFGRTT